MTLRDEIAEELGKPYDSKLSGVFIPKYTQIPPIHVKRITDSILAIIKPRFDEIRGLTGIETVISKHGDESEAYAKLYNTASELQTTICAIYQLCTLDEPEQDEVEIGTLRQRIMTELQPVGKEELLRFFEKFLKDLQLIKEARDE